MSRDATLGDAPSQPRRALFGVKRSEYEHLDARLAEQVGVSEELRAQLAAAQARDRARDARLEAVLGDAEALAGEIDRAVTTLTGLLGAEWSGAEEDLAGALRALLPRRAAAVEVLRAEQLPEAQHNHLAARTHGSMTWQLSDANAAGEPYLGGTAALAGERVVLVRYVEGIHDDGSLSEIVERICRAATASLAARDLARERGRRLPLSLLGDESAARRFAALRNSQEQAPLEHVAVLLRAGERQKFTGLFGEPAWSAALFGLAVELDRAARAVGGEAFETDSGFVCVAPAPAIGALRTTLAALLAPDGTSANLEIAALAAA